jgi:DNA-binding MarR family transcriptional regulator
VNPATNLPLLISQGLSKISIALRSHAQQSATGEQLSPTQGQILNRVLLAGPQRLSTLSQDLAVSLPTVSDAVTTLVQKKLLTKQRDPQDARAQTVQLTRKGQTLATRTNQWPDFLASAVDVLSPEEQVLFHRRIAAKFPSLACVSVASFSNRSRTPASPGPTIAITSTPLSEKSISASIAMSFNPPPTPNPTASGSRLYDSTPTFTPDPR